ncbi:hypothetical protein METBIDRAFT_221533 [Metschnikowia bicuspidata var. bicuspidata NRRL YB-4993]|uniref:Uncharacterized protein n=1 Tax=Metschnikowia bicuspidata var. bicuspidata NRRL YB-4993 TaxID=869754 RepID=A0A1A0H5W1_9ASCO|nr:hypothetical protein METBIDRAFT_221533 [Metschnikowia bicuspidata var. bicuspidata NRRL YB-4993]OBA19303.1 hypothetical protein METBIDRAFT_221533 [Metschnikowia bicuspidata var. bicuspidata NRRL YB-4993]
MAARSYSAHGVRRLHHHATPNTTPRQGRHVARFLRAQNQKDSPKPKIPAKTRNTGQNQKYRPKPEIPAKTRKTDQHQKNRPAPEMRPKQESSRTPGCSRALAASPSISPQPGIPRAPVPPRNRRKKRLISSWGKKRPIRNKPHVIPGPFFPDPVFRSCPRTFSTRTFSSTSTLFSRTRAFLLGACFCPDPRFPPRRSHF